MGAPCAAVSQVVIDAAGRKIEGTDLIQAETRQNQISAFNLPPNSINNHL